jgi:DNA topoisomerase-1
LQPETGLRGTDQIISFVCSIEPKTEKEANEIIEKARVSTWQVDRVEESEALRKARAPFTTSTLQQAASSRLGYSPSQTMRLAQKLYEAGHITYMRTDSTNLSEQAIKEITSVIKETYGNKYAEPKKFATKSKNAQEAHEAIRPTHASILEAGASEQERKLYKLIWMRTIASQMADAKLLKTKIIATPKVKFPFSSDTLNQIPDFIASGSRVIFDGWLAADPGARSEDVELPAVKSGDTLKLININSEGKETQPPNRYSEAGLVKELEKRGIGRPSTYASIIKTIIDRGYVIKEQKTLRPSDTGEIVSDFLEKNFADYISDTFTAKMEDELDDIAKGKRQYVKTLKDFYDRFKKDVDSKSKTEKITNLGDAPKDIRCPECGATMIIKLSRNGKFYSCSRFPDCNGALTIEGKKIEPPKSLGQPCPKCGKGELVEREGRFGKFVSCSLYPKCKYIKKDETSGVGGSGDTGVKCNLCGKGTMVEKRGRFGIFYGCSNYPDCKNIIKAKPTGNICPICQSLMMVGTKTIPERCSNKACINHNPHKLNKKTE